MGMAGLVWALLASAQGDDGAYRTFADRYVAMAHALQFEGHMATARTMKQQSTPFT
jgi:adenylate cyclase